MSDTSKHGKAAPYDRAFAQTPEPIDAIGGIPAELALVITADVLLAACVEGVRS